MSVHFKMQCTETIPSREWRRHNAGIEGISTMPPPSMCLSWSTFVNPGKDILFEYIPEYSAHHTVMQIGYHTTLLLHVGFIAV
jgi:hypothetical protein